VRYRRTGTDTWEEITTDDAGVATIDRPLPGLYRVYVGRTLTAGEAAAAGSPVRAFGDGRTVTLESSGGLQLEFLPRADTVGTLVISEVSGYAPPPWETNGSYNDAMYFEVFNNSSTMQFLDGLLFGPSVWGTETIPTPCVASQPARSDPAGVYAEQVIQFPGSGSEFPILPGQASVVALSAIDHRFAHPDLIDLSGASFEIRGAASADNPSVPDMLDVGLSPFVVNLGGVSVSRLTPGAESYFLARGPRPSELPILYRDGNGVGSVRIARSDILDVAALTGEYVESEREFPPCAPFVHPDFDRYEGGFLPIALGVETPRLSFQRRGLRLEDGHQLLQDTGTSAVDFFLGDLTPGTVPNSN
jgi:hypothetical protein